MTPTINFNASKLAYLYTVDDICVPIYYDQLIPCCQNKVIVSRSNARHTRIVDAILSEYVDAFINGAAKVTIKFMLTTINTRWKGKDTKGGPNETTKVCRSSVTLFIPEKWTMLKDITDYVTYDAGVWNRSAHKYIPHPASRQDYENTGCMLLIKSSKLRRALDYNPTADTDNTYAYGIMSKDLERDPVVTDCILSFNGIQIKNIPIDCWDANCFPKFNIVISNEIKSKFGDNNKKMYPVCIGTVRVLYQFNWTVDQICKSVMHAIIDGELSPIFLTCPNFIKDLAAKAILDYGFGTPENTKYPDSNLNSFVYDTVRQMISEIEMLYNKAPLLGTTIINDKYDKCMPTSHIAFARDMLDHNIALGGYDANCLFKDAIFANKELAKRALQARTEGTFNKL